ncbi:acid phosphatase [Paraburkholderia caballeronis]|uniref:Acid phosphatase n=1 Tax=Paraburkholderia caballeronis TaxID=416943 RepID=A0A1H7V1X8_9BURK|nr:acid phosphatase [Paraburkholderia caballeronis]PXW16860.1 acid phosphatase [Paraburkholderia caballeronis]PXW94496.1 acid phosphatase [Paraburkholderia caballeronis]RAJ89839.1 acid phosphatase [Paraburkholderia caballeronis]TDV04631.1 acid phosphatase [Paraburkholderia caballeronis]TDV07774.1 acid phosphatase [Paraburkholderia caballeronis]
MKKKLIHATPIAVAAAALALSGCGGNDDNPRPSISTIKNIVVIYAENRSFDNLYGTFPGANGLQNATAASKLQLDRSGQPLATLPVAWGGLTQPKQSVTVTEAQTANMPNQPFSINDPAGLNVPLNIATRDLYHRFYENQMQIDGGKNDMFVAWADSGGLVMGNYITNADTLPLWKVAQKYTLADNFFMGAFGGSFLNHQWLVCACTPTFPNALNMNAKTSVSAVENDGTSLTLDPTSPASAMDGKPLFKNSGNLTPDLYAVNTMQPPYQPSGNAPADGGDTALADPNPAAGTTLPPQTATHIGDLLDKANVSWAWYGGAWGAAVAARQSGQWTSVTAGNLTVPNFQTHHQPFNYFADLAPGTEARAKHLLDGGMDGSEFIKAIDAGTLPQVAFYKPQGNLNEHAGYTDVESGDQHIAEVISHLEKSPQWKNMVVVVTYDENGGFWDHVSPPKGDRWGPGSRIPALVVSPLAKKGFVDHTQYDTTSILRLITRRFSLPMLPGLTNRDEKLKANGAQPMGDLTNALDIAL